MKKCANKERLRRSKIALGRKKNERSEKLNVRRKTRKEREEKRSMTNGGLSGSACAKSSEPSMTSVIESARRGMSDDDEKIVNGIETTIAIAVEL